MEFQKGVGCRELQEEGTAGESAVGIVEFWIFCSNIAIIYANNAVTGGCQDRHLLAAASGTHACCHSLLPPSSVFMKVAANTFQRTSAHLSCDRMLPQPSARGQPALLPALSLPEGCRLLRRAAAGPRAHSPPGTLCTGQCLLRA